MGDTRTVLCDYVEANKVQFLIMGTRGHTGIKRYYIRPKYVWCLLCYFQCYHKQFSSYVRTFTDHYVAPLWVASHNIAPNMHPVMLW